MIKERPIVFSTEMVKAIIDNRKTMTRRVIKWPVRGYSDRYKTRLHLVDELPREYDKIVKYCPYGQVGDELWVRETWEDVYGEIIYKADCPQLDTNWYGISWHPSIFMPRKLSRITIEITNIRVEKLQDISEDDAANEGMGELEKEYWRNTKTLPIFFVPVFKWYWNKLNTKRGYSWKSNCWVWVIGFKRVK